MSAFDPKRTSPGGRPSEPEIRVADDAIVGRELRVEQMQGLGFEQIQQLLGLGISDDEFHQYRFFAGCGRYSPPGHLSVVEWRKGVKSQSRSSGKTCSGGAI